MLMNNEDQFELLRKIKKNSFQSQRELADQLGFSLGKIKIKSKVFRLLFQ